LLDEKYQAKIESRLGNISFGGIYRTNPVNGVYNFTLLEIKGAPTLNGSIYVESDAIEQKKYEIISGEQYEAPEFEF